MNDDIQELLKELSKLKATMNKHAETMVYSQKVQQEQQDSIDSCRDLVDSLQDVLDRQRISLQESREFLESLGDKIITFGAAVQAMRDETNDKEQGNG